MKLRVTRHWLELANQWLEVTRQFSCLDSDSTRPSHDSDSTRKNFRWLWLEGLVTLTRQKWLGHITVSQSSPIRWQMAYFYVFCGKNILTKLVGYNQPTCLCVNMEIVVGNISFSCELYSFSWSCFVHVGLAQLCTENGVSLYMCSAVEVAWLAQNIRRSSKRVWLHLQRRLGVSSEY